MSRMQYDRIRAKLENLWAKAIQEEEHAGATKAHCFSICQIQYAFENKAKREGLEKG